MVYGAVITGTYASIAIKSVKTLTGKKKKRRAKKK